MKKLMLVIATIVALGTASVVATTSAVLADPRCSGSKLLTLPRLLERRRPMKKLMLVLATVLALGSASLAAVTSLPRAAFADLCSGSNC